MDTGKITKRFLADSLLSYTTHGFVCLFVFVRIVYARVNVIVKYFKTAVKIDIFFLYFCIF